MIVLYGLVERLYTRVSCTKISTRTFFHITSCDTSNLYIRVHSQSAHKLYVYFFSLLKFSFFTHRSPSSSSCPDGLSLVYFSFCRFSLSFLMSCIFISSTDHNLNGNEVFLTAALDDFSISRIFFNIKFAIGRGQRVCSAFHVIVEWLVCALEIST